MYVGLILPVMVSLVGIYLLIKLRAFYIIRPISTLKEFCAELSDRSSRRSFFLALAGTLGVGNIFGVAAGLMIGGPGSLFWLFISSFFAMIIKYSETLMVIDAGVKKGGTAALLKETFGRIGRLISPFYAILTVLLAFFMGASMQSVAVVDVAEKSLGLHPQVSVFILILLLAPAFFGGAKKIESITEILIPMTTIIYIIMCFSVVLLNFAKVGQVISEIISSAFSFKSALGGGVSLLMVREGFARGILSNEAGVGTSALAHSRSESHSPHTAGLFAMCEVVFDSSILCVLTGVAILTSLPDISTFSTPMALVSAAFSNALGGDFSFILSFLILSFAYSTIICWYFYGIELSRLYFPRCASCYPVLFITAILFCIQIPTNLMLCVIDIILFLMSCMTLSAIIKRSSRIQAICLSSNRKNPE